MLVQVVIFQRLLDGPTNPIKASIPPQAFREAYQQIQRETDQVLVLVGSSKLSGGQQVALAEARPFLGRCRIVVADSGVRQAWLEVDLGKPQTFSKVALHEWEGAGNRIQKFEVQFKDGAGWKTIFGGTTMGSGFTRSATAIRPTILFPAAMTTTVLPWF